MQEQIGLGTVLVNTLSNMGWVGFTFACAMAVVMLVWLLAPFAVFGIKQRLEAIERVMATGNELSVAELKRANDLLAMTMAEKDGAGRMHTGTAGRVIHPASYDRPPMTAAHLDAARAETATASMHDAA